MFHRDIIFINVTNIEYSTDNLKSRKKSSQINTLDNLVSDGKPQRESCAVLQLSFLRWFIDFYFAFPAITPFDLLNDDFQ